MNISTSRILFTIILTVTVSIMSQAQINRILDNIKLKKAPDTRTAVWEITAEKENDIYNLNGKLDNESTKKEILDSLDSNGIKYNDKIVVLPNTNQKWGLIMLSVASLRTDGKHAA